MPKKNEPDWPIIDWTAFEQQQTSAGEVPEWALERVYELWQDTSLLEAFARYIAAHEPKGEVPPLVRAREEYAKCLRSEIAPLTMSGEPSYSQADIWERAFTRYIATHEPKGEVPKLLTQAEWRELLSTAWVDPDEKLPELRERGLIAHEPEPVDPLVAALASIDIGLSDIELQKLKDMGVTVTAPARGEGA